MTCLRCGYCCTCMMVPILVDGNLPPTEDNIAFHAGDGPCRHLDGDKPGEYSCVIHDGAWFHETPCADHNSEVDKCRTGEYIMAGKSVLITAKLTRCTCRSRRTTFTESLADYPTRHLDRECAIHGEVADPDAWRKQ